VELWDSFGLLLYRYDTGHIPVLICGTSNYEDIRFASVTKEKIIKVHKISMERIKNITEEQEAFEHIGTQTNLVKIDIEEEG